ncbi:hypothetical protein ACGFYT_15875 [Streptomyces sp. NPDC048208]|uniref:hypothetical protein n=1 Tax=Streptomyces sp. NPDC048208 TaxID=3365515 RepID=UPI00370FFBE1
MNRPTTAAEGPVSSTEPQAAGEDQFAEREGQDQLGDPRLYRQVQRGDVERHGGAQQGEPQGEVGGDPAEPPDP